MRRLLNVFLITAIFAVAFYRLVAGQEGRPDSLSDLSADAYRYADKSAVAAFIIGLAPGFFLHGAGHYYITDKKTGNILMVSEAISIPIMLAAVADGLGNIDSGNENRLLQAAGGLAMIAFVGGWVIDFLGAPNKVIDSRKALKATPQVSLIARDKSVGLNFSIPF